MTYPGIGNTQDVAIQDQFTPVVTLYLHDTVATPTLTSPIVVGDKTFAIDSNAGIVNQSAVSINEGTNFFQTIVLSTTANSMTVASGSDHAFSALASVRNGSWNMNVDGSSATKIFYVEAPSLAKFDIYGINVSITDEVVMDSAKFGGISALTNGIGIRHVNGCRKTLALVVNNIGFAEHGFDLTYDPKAPAGVYGLIARNNIHINSGVSIRVDGSLSDRLEFVVRDDLTALLHLSCVVSGHVVLD